MCADKVEDQLHTKHDIDIEEYVRNTKNEVSESLLVESRLTTICQQQLTRYKLIRGGDQCQFSFMLKECIFNILKLFTDYDISSYSDACRGLFNCNLFKK